MQHLFHHSQALKLLDPTCKKVALLLNAMRIEAQLDQQEEKHIHSFTNKNEGHGKECPDWTLIEILEKKF